MPFVRTCATVDMLDRSTPVRRLLPSELSLLVAYSTIFFVSPSCKVQTVVSQTVIQFTCSFNRRKVQIRSFRI